jgi:hypothetical protein
LTAQISVCPPHRPLRSIALALLVATAWPLGTISTTDLAMGSTPRYARIGNALCDSAYQEIQRKLGDITATDGAALLIAQNIINRTFTKLTLRLTGLKVPPARGRSLRRALALQRQSNAYLAGVVRDLSRAKPSQRAAIYNHSVPRLNQLAAAPDHWYRAAGLTHCTSR